MITVLRVAIICTFATALASCSTFQPYEEIQPSFATAQNFTALSCQQIFDQHNQVAQQLGGLAFAQQRAIRRDQIGRTAYVAGFGLIGALTMNAVSNSVGDESEAIASLKGQEQALREAYTINGCTG